MSKTLYHYSATTGEFLSTSQADASPLEPGVWLIPALATAIEPPTPAAQEAAIFVEGQWQITPDHRNEIWYDTRTAQPVTMNQLGPVSDSLTTHAPPSPNHRWLNGEWLLDEQALLMQQTNEAEAQKAQLVQQANQRIEPLQDAAELGIANAEESAQLKAWKHYRVLLNRVPQQANWPSAIDWPAIPPDEIPPNPSLLQSMLGYFKPETA